jgi:MraZ protein
LAFRGTFEYSLDAKKRLTVPARFRSTLSGGVVLAKQVDPCVALWRPDDYEAYTQSILQGLHPFSAEAQQLERFFAANAVDTELDAAGRVGIPAFLLEYGGLDKEVVVTGGNRCLEIWDRAAWAEHSKGLEASMADIRRRLGTAG